MSIEEILQNIYRSSNTYRLLNDADYFITQLSNNYNPAYKSDYRLLDRAIRSGAGNIVYQFQQQNAVPSPAEKQQFTQMLQQRAGFTSGESARIVGLLFNMVGWNGGIKSAPAKVTFRYALENNLSLKNYARFKGRTGRREYIYFFLFGLIVSALVPIGVVFSTEAFDGGVVYTIPLILAVIINLLLFIPQIAIEYRRLQDTGRSGMFIFFIFVPIVGFIMLLIWLLSEGTPGPNQYGDAPN